MQFQAPLSNLQQELLKLYASNISETDLLVIKRYLAKYFAEKAIAQADEIWDTKGYTNETMKNWLNEDNEKYE
jgi:predicted transcriptional regulator